MPNQSPPERESSGLTFMRALHAAMPKLIGPRARAAEFQQALAQAIRCRFDFHPDDAAALGRMNVHTSKRSFMALDEAFYAQACYYGSNYARMWEAHHKQAPWMAPEVAHRDRRDFIAASRVAPNFGVLIDEDDTFHGLARLHGKQLWWCTSIDNDFITLCRYKPRGNDEYGRYGAPAKRRKISRDEWEDLFKVVGHASEDANSNPRNSPR